MLDVIDAVRKKRAQEAKGALLNLQVLNARHMERRDYERFVNDLMRKSDLAKKTEKFDRGAMDALHAFTKTTKRGG